MSETARYAGVPTATIRSWFMPRAAGASPLFPLGFGSIDGKHVVSFVGLIEAYVAGHLRSAGVKLPTLRRANALLQATLGTAYPFAHASFPTAGRRALHDDGGPELATVAGRSFFDGMKLDRMSYEVGTGLAEEWEIDPGILIRPGLSAGDPVIEGTGVKTYILSNQYHANYKDAPFVASLFRVTEAEVLRAAAFEGKLPKRAA